MNVGLYAIFVQKTLQNARVRSGNLLALEPLKAQSLIVRHASLRYGQRKTALAEIQSLNNLSILLALLELVLAHNAHIGNATGHRLRNIVIAEIENLHWEVLGWDKQSAFALLNLDAALAEHGHGLFKKTTLGLYGYAKCCHSMIVCFFIQ